MEKPWSLAADGGSDQSKVVVQVEEGAEKLQCREIIAHEFE